MRKIRKLCLVLSLLLVLSFFVTTPVSAASIINNYSGTICDSGSMRLSWSAWTNCTTTIDFGSLTVRLQYLDNGTWTTVATIYDSATNVITVTDGQNRYISKAGSYRIYTTHYVRVGTETQTKYSTSNIANVN